MNKQRSESGVKNSVSRRERRKLPQPAAPRNTRCRKRREKCSSVSIDEEVLTDVLETAETFVGRSQLRNEVWRPRLIAEK